MTRGLMNSLMYVYDKLRPIVTITVVLEVEPYSGFYLVLLKWLAVGVIGTNRKFCSGLRNLTCGNMN